MTQRTTRAQRLAMPLARNVVRELAVSHGGCVRPVQLRRTDLQTGQTEPVLVPCGHTFAAVCPSCAERNRTLRAAQCREGWHLESEPIVQADEPDDEQRLWIELRARAQQEHDQAETAGEDTAGDDEVMGELDEQITRSGMRGNVLPAKPVRRHRSTRRRQDAPDLPRRKVAPRTIGKTYTAADGKTFRPSMFLTLTCPSYGRVREDGTPADPAPYDYQRAARDALHFAALFDRFIQNLRRFLGYDVQYFAAVEPQRRLAPHIHIAMRGTLSRTELRQVLAATYHQVWWPDTSTVRYHDGELPIWHEASGNYLDPATGEVLPDLGPGPGCHRPRGRAAARRPVRPAVRRPGRHRRIPRCEPVHRLPDQVPDQARRRLPPGHRPQPSMSTRTGWPRRCGTSRARRRARTGCATASSPRTPGPACARGTARARPTAANTSATPGAASWSPANGRARPWPITAPTARTGSWTPSGFRQPTRPATPGNPSPPATPTTCPTPNGCCTSSPTASDGTPRSPSPEREPAASQRQNFRQPGRPHERTPRHKPRAAAASRRDDCRGTPGAAGGR